MSELKIDTIVNYLPDLSERFPGADDKFLFFFEPVILEEKFFFGLSLKTGVQIFSIITLIQAINAFLDIFRPYSFWLFIISIIAFIIHFAVAFYAFLSTLKNNYSYSKVSYLIISVLFLIEAAYYISRSVLKIIDFITPWDADFLQLNFLIYIFGYGIFLLFYLYFIYILYRYMLQLKNGEKSKNDEELGSLNDNSQI
jgi:hypothetical protein